MVGEPLRSGERCVVARLFIIQPMIPATFDPLSERDVSRLSDFLDSVPDNAAMTIEEMDGFFCALIVGPDVVFPSEYLPILLGGNPGDTHAFRTMREANRTLQLLMRYWNSIVTSLRRLGAYAPLFDAADSKGVVGRLWAQGFMQGVELRFEGWQDLLADDNSGDLLMIATVAGEVDPAWPKRKISRKKMDEINLLMAAGVARAHAHFLKQRSSASTNSPAPAVREPERRPAAKVGRNDPCPCGSGLKFKKCHCGLSGNGPH
jgi:uncharacterized protein